MVRRVCLDSDVLIALLGKDERTRGIIASLNADFYTTSVNSFEIWYGRKKQEMVFELLEWLNLIHLDDRAARLAADMLRHLKKKGRIMDLRDLFIAAICVRNDVELLTHNKKHFEGLREFGLLLV